MPLFRRRPVPPAVRGVALQPGDRRVGWALTVDGQPVVATEQGLLLPGRDLVEWSQVERASWARPRLTVVQVSDVAGSGTTTAAELVDEGDLPEVVRTRVTGSVAWSSHARLQPAGGVRVVGRRVPGPEVLSWQLVYDPGTDVDDPLVRAQAQQLLEGARRTIG